MGRLAEAQTHRRPQSEYQSSGPQLMLSMILLQLT